MNQESDTETQTGQPVGQRPLVRFLTDCLPNIIVDQRRDDGFRIGEMEMSLGKYRGDIIDEIPLKYLDDTISKMDGWIGRAVQRYVDACMDALMEEGLVTKMRVPNYSWYQLKCRIVEQSPDASYL